ARDASTCAGNAQACARAATTRAGSAQTCVRAAITRAGIILELVLELLRFKFRQLRLPHYLPLPPLIIPTLHFFTVWINTNGEFISGRYFHEPRHVAFKENRSMENKQYNFKTFKRPGHGHYRGIQWNRSHNGPNGGFKRGKSRCGSPK